jgi:hypothetical protein
MMTTMMVVVVVMMMMMMMPTTMTTLFENWLLMCVAHSKIQLSHLPAGYNKVKTAALGNPIKYSIRQFLLLRFTYF